MIRCFTRFPIGGLGEPNIYQNLVWITMCGILLGVCLTCEELVGEVNHTTECVTDLFSFVDVEWIILRSNSNLWVSNGYSEKVTPLR